MTEFPITRYLDIVGCFEGGSARRYAALAYVPGDSGQLSGGRLQASMTSGNLGKLLRAYRNAGGTLISEEEVRQTEAMDPSQNTDKTIRAQFKAAAADPIMQRVQDEFFTEKFVKPALKFAARYGLTEPLPCCLVVDAFIHGSFKRIADQVVAKKPKDQREWAKLYVAIRKNWLATHANKTLHQTVYRMNFFETEIAKNNWNLDVPMKVHGYLLNS